MDREERIENRNEGKWFGLSSTSFRFYWHCRLESSFIWFASKLILGNLALIKYDNLLSTKWKSLVMSPNKDVSLGECINTFYNFFTKCFVF